MGQIIDFKTREIVTHKPTAKFEIIQWNDPIVRDMERVDGRVCVDGLVPVALALQLKELCDRFNAAA